MKTELVSIAFLPNDDELGVRELPEIGGGHVRCLKSGGVFPFLPLQIPANAKPGSEATLHLHWATIQPGSVAVQAAFAVFGIVTRPKTSMPFGASALQVVFAEQYRLSIAHFARTLTVHPNDILNFNLTMSHQDQAELAILGLDIILEVETP